MHSRWHPCSWPCGSLIFVGLGVVLVPHCRLGILTLQTAAGWILDYSDLAHWPSYGFLMSLGPSVLSGNLSIQTDIFASAGQGLCFTEHWTTLISSYGWPIFFSLFERLDL